MHKEYDPDLDLKSAFLARFPPSIYSSPCQSVSLFLNAPSSLYSDFSRYVGVEIVWSDIVDGFLLSYLTLI